jgi:mannose-6-phosphate isomerase-like protein (cupin superfamily)
MTDYRTRRDEDTVTHVEEGLFPPLTIVDLKREAASVEQTYKTFVVLKVNNHCIRLAVMRGEFRWHQHPHSDECFLLLEGELDIDLATGQTFRLKPGEAFTILAGAIHRTRSRVPGGEFVLRRSHRIYRRGIRRPGLTGKAKNYI